MPALSNPDTARSEPERDLQASLLLQRRAFRAEGAVSYATRVDRLDRCIALLVEKQDTLCEALQRDFGCRSRYVTLMSEVMTCIGSLKNARKNLKTWMKPERRKPAQNDGHPAALQQQAGQDIAQSDQKLAGCEPNLEDP